MEELKDEIEKVLIRKDGKLNSPLLKNPKTNKLIGKIKKATTFLDNDVSISRRWWHIKHLTNSIPKCYCGTDVIWNDGYSKYCSHYCFCHSEETKSRVSAQFKGLAQTETHREKSANSRRGLVRTNITKKKLRIGKLGDKNPMFGKTPWNNGLYGANNPLFGRKFPNRGLKGKLNPMFGKSPSNKVGRGVFGYYNKLYFRSSLELFYLLYWDYTNISVISAETKRFRVEYEYNNEVKSYVPDFFDHTNKKLFEIKPEKMQSNTVVQIKFAELEKAHPKIDCVLCGYKEIANYLIYVIENDIIEDNIKNKKIILTDRNLSKLRKGYKDGYREAKKHTR